MLPEEQSKTPESTKTPTHKISDMGPIRRGFTERHVEKFQSGQTTGACAEWRSALRDVLAVMGSGSIMVLLGMRGTGKTQIATDVACSMISEMNASEVPEKKWPRYVVASDIFREIKRAFGRNAQVYEGDVMKSFLEPSLLVIDEAHERGETSFEDLSLTYIIDQRYARNRDTILITNQTKVIFAKSIGSSVVSRVHECGQLIECTWKSFRQKKES